MYARVFLTLFFLVNTAFAADLDIAKKLFETLQLKSDAFDSSVADCYADHATMKNTRHYPDGRTRVLEMTGAKYKKMLRAAMPLAKAREDRSEFRDVAYEEADGVIVVTASRWSVLKQYESPYLAHIEVVEGVAKIVKEETESKP